MTKVDNWLNNVAYETAKLSYCKRKQVGAVIAINGRIISSGYNGTPTGLDNCCEDMQDRSKNTVIHAEANAILFAARNGIPLQGSTLYVTMSPCIECTKMIIQAGITRVVYSELYRESIDTLYLLSNAGIKVESSHDRTTDTKENN